MLDFTRTVAEVKRKVADIIQEKWPELYGHGWPELYGGWPELYGFQVTFLNKYCRFLNVRGQQTDYIFVSNWFEGKCFDSFVKLLQTRRNPNRSGRNYTALL